MSVCQSLPHRAAERAERFVSSVGPMRLHGRHLNEVSASTVGELTAAVGNSAVDKILLAAGTYYLMSDMCTRSTAP